MPHAQITEVTTFEPCKPKEQTILLSIPDCPSMSLSIKLPISRPCEGAAPTTKSETVPGPFRTRLREGVATKVVCALSGSPIHAQSAAPATQFKPCETFARPCQWSRLRDRFCILLSPSSQRMDPAPCESAAPATKSALDLAKVLRLPRNLYLTLRKCCACHATQTLRNLRAAVPMGPSPNPFRDRSKTVPRPRPYRRRDRHDLVVCALSGSPIHAQRQRFCILLSPSSQRVDAAPCESAAPATKSILDLAKVLRLPRNSNLAKPSRGRANGPVSEPVPHPFRDRSETVPRPRVATEVVCAPSGSPIHAQRQRFLHLAIPQLA